MRPAAQALGGFYKLLPELIPSIAALVDARGGMPIGISLGGQHTILDPCAGEGEAVLLLRDALWGAEDAKTTGLWAVELEASRFAVLEAQPALKDKYKINLLHGDAMAVEFKLDEGRTMYGTRHYRGATVLYLNAPYHNGWLEAAFLERWTGALAGGGVLIDVLPHYALDKSAATIATHYTNIHCYRFPGASFSVFKQCVLFAVKRTAPLLEPDPVVVAMLEGWAADAGMLAELPDAGTVAPVVRIATGGGAGGEGSIASWRMKPADTDQLLKRIVPWHESDRAGALVPILGVMPEVVGDDLLRRVYPMATAPSSAYVGTAIAGGVYNGAKVQPDDPSSGRPDLLVKGVFDKDHKTIDENTNKDGVVTSIIRIQQPRLRVTVLDLKRHKYVTLVDDDIETGSADVERMSVGDLIAHYGIDLLRVLRENCPLTHDANEPDDVIPLPELKRPLFRAQGHAVMALVKLLGGLKATRRQRRGLGAYLLGEVGTGKCLGLGTPVLRFDGTVVPVESVREGDLLMGPDSKPRRVLGTTRGTGPLYQVTPVKGAPWVCNDAHILTMVHTVTGDVFDIPAKEYATNRRLRKVLSAGTRTTHPRTDFKQFFPDNGVDFPAAAALPIDPYFLGVWYGDGTKHVNFKGKELTGVHVTKPDHEIRALMHETAAEWGVRVVERINTGGCPTFALVRIGTTNALLHAMRRVYKDGASLPRAYLTSSRNDRMVFLAGLLDTDGSYCNGCYDFVQKRKQWATDVCFLAGSLGIRATMVEKIVNDESYWRVCLSGDFTCVPLRIARKIAVERQQKKRVCRTGITVEPIGVGEYAGFQVEGDGRFLLGDFTVTHNSFCGLAAAQAMGMRMVLVTCPPHLLDSWIEQTALAVEGARAVVLETVDDLDRLAAENYPGMTVAILSESKAKLASAFDGVRLGYCPECNAKLPTPKKLKSAKPKVLKPGEKEDPFDAQAAELARTRATCVATYRQATGYRSRAAHALAIALLPVMPHAPEVAQCLSGRHERRMLERARDRVPMVAFKRRSPEDVEIFMVDKGESTPEELAALAKVRGGAALRHAIRVMAATVLENHDDYTIKREFQDTLVGLLWACNDPIVTAHTAEWINRRVVEKLKTPERPWWLRDVATLARDLLHLLDAGSEAQRAAVTRMRVNEPAEAWQDWRAWEITRDKIIDTTATTPGKDQPHIGHSLKVGDRCIATWEGSPAGSLAALTTAHRMLAAHAGWRTTEPCGAVLYQVTAKPRRYPLAKYITRKHRNLFELMIADESHQAKNGDSARSQAIRRIVRMGVPTIAATGSVMGGLAADLFAMQWALDPRFRIEFPNGYGVRERVVKGVTVGRKFSDVNEFCRRYGFLKECVDLTGNKPVADAKYGSMSDRVEESGVRTVGYAPGVLPLFVLLYLLRIAVVIHKSDLDAELPPCNEIVDYVDPSPEQKAANDLLERKLLEQIKKDRWSKLLAGKLMGAMAEFPSFLDRASADVGNVPVGEHRGEYRICYPRNVDLGSAAGQCIVSAPGIDPAVLLPKEAWMIETVRRELAEGRNCMVFATHKALLPRLKRVLFEALNEPIALLDASKVEADERIAWINHNVRGKAAVVERRGKEIEEPGITARVLVVNSAAVQTGINNLVWFPTEIWMENPQCDAIAYRQTVGRVHRIGQDKEVRIYFPLYKGTSQVHAHTLLMHKVAVSLGTDGLDASSALAAAGVGEGTGLDGYSVGRLLFDLRTGEREMPTYKPKARQALKATPPAATAPPAVPVEPPVLAAVPDPEAPVEPTPAPSSVAVAIVGATSTRRGLSRGR